MGELIFSPVCPHWSLSIFSSKSIDLKGPHGFNLHFFVSEGEAHTLLVTCISSMNPWLFFDYSDLRFLGRNSLIITDTRMYVCTYVFIYYRLWINFVMDPICAVSISCILKLWCVFHWPPDLCVLEGHASH